MSITCRYAIIIVGAGPAGISTALHLAQTAPDLVKETLIIEKSRHPRPKLCGGGILPDGEAILERLGLDLGEVPHCDVDWARFDFAGRGMRFRPDKKRAYAFRTIQRDAFDAWLADKARQLGFRFLENTTVEQVIPGEGFALVKTSRGVYRARVVVAADGASSIVRRAVNPHGKPRLARLLEVVTPPRPETSFHIQSDSYFDYRYLPEGVQGYVWDFPTTRQGQAVRVRGIYDANIYNLSAAISLPEALADEFRRHGYILEEYRLESQPLRWFDPKSTFAMPGVLLAGDAAGADVLYGEGISFALGYGALAAEAIAAAFKHGDFSFRDYRRQILRSPMGAALCRRAAFARFFYFSLRWGPLQAFLWRRMGWFIRWLVRTFFIGWARG